jgi:hypothetical protein
LPGLNLLLDQLARNLFRNSPRAYATDPAALGTASEAVARGYDRAVAPVRRCFFYLPFQHSESLTSAPGSAEPVPVRACIPVGSSTRTVRAPPLRAPRVMSPPSSQTIERVTERPSVVLPLGVFIRISGEPFTEFAVVALDPGNDNEKLPAVTFGPDRALRHSHQRPMGDRSGHPLDTALPGLCGHLPRSGTMPAAHRCRSAGCWCAIQPASTSRQRSSAPTWMRHRR